MGWLRYLFLPPPSLAYAFAVVVPTFLAVVVAVLTCNLVVVMGGTQVPGVTAGISIGLLLEIAWITILCRLKSSTRQHLFRISSACVAALIGMLVGGAVGSSIAAAMGRVGWSWEMVSFFLGAGIVGFLFVVWDWRHGALVRARHP